MLRKTVTSIHPLSEAELEQLEGICHERSYAKGEHLFWSGDVCRGLYFVKQGVVGLYGLRDGKEIYQDFFLDGQFATDVSSLVSQEPSSLFLRAVEGSTIKYIRREDLLGLYEQSSNFQHLGRKVLEQLLVGRTELSVRQSTLSAVERYQYVLEHQPALLERITLRHLATYLGMTRETLSRVRRKK
ncbi:hypothetical protein A3850_012065 [Lewinella sp. 4G2]|nr:Crp/Fnr family transcriptional regulator [Lewinella sp. 4G2]OAV45182.1 hypothetical protein A3850_012065 [Lewinella sp. 4G2]